DAVPPPRSVFVQRLYFHHPSVVDQDVQRAKMCDCLLDGTADFDLLTHIAAYAQCCAAGLVDLARDSSGRFDAPTHEDYHGTLTRKKPRRGFANTGGRSADPRYLTIQPSADGGGSRGRRSRC